jgi:hypothetical protein
MALFKAAALKDGNKPHPVDIRLGHIEEDGKELPVILTLNMSKRLMEVYQEADDLYHASPRLPVLSRKEARKQKKVEARMVTNHIEFCKMILGAGYADSQNLIDKPSKELILLAVEQEPGFAEQLSHSLYYYFSGEGKFQFETDEEAEKKT